MNVHTSHEIYSGLLAIEVSSLEFFDGSTLARALRCPRPLLAANLRAQGALSDDGHRTLTELWAAMQTIEPAQEGRDLLFDNIYDLLLWVYVHTPDYELAPASRRAKLIFRGQRDASWGLETSAHRRLQTPQDRAKNQASIDRFIAAISAEFPQKLLTTDLEREAVAQHYGFPTNLLDFTTDVDVAAYFATQDAASAPRGTIFLSDTTALLRNGRVRFIKIPEHFTRPNVQKGLFVSLPDTDTDEGVQAHFTRLTFRHCPLDRFPALTRAADHVEPHDEVAVLADQVSGGQPAEPHAPLSDGLGPALTILDDPAHPEVVVYGQRVAEYAGIITDEPALELRTDILKEIVRTSATGVTTFISVVRIFASWSFFLDETAPAAVVPFVQLAEALAALYGEVWQDTSHAELLSRAVAPARILLLDSDLARAADRGRRAAFRLRLFRGSRQEDQDSDDANVIKIDFERGIPSDARMRRAFDTVEAMESTLVVLNLHRLIDAVGENGARAVLGDLARLRHGVVGTATPEPYGFVLQPYFDLTLMGAMAPPTRPHEAWTTARWKQVLNQADEAISLESPVIADIGPIELTRGRRLRLSWVGPTGNIGRGQNRLRLACSVYNVLDAAENGMKIAPGAVNAVLGGPLAGADYERIASQLMNDSTVGADFAAGAREYVRFLRTEPDCRRPAFSRLLASLEFHPMQEVAILALHHAATGEVRQPFETF